MDTVGKAVNVHVVVKLMTKDMRFIRLRVSASKNVLFAVKLKRFPTNGTKINVLAAAQLSV